VHIHNAETKCFLSGKERKKFSQLSHDCSGTVLHTDQSHKALPYASWYFLISLFFMYYFVYLANKQSDENI